MKYRRNKKIIKRANEIVKRWAKENFETQSWVYTDFVEGNRFIDAIQEDGDININNKTARQLGEYAIKEISESIFFETISLDFPIS